MPGSRAKGVPSFCTNSIKRSYSESSLSNSCSLMSNGAGPSPTQNVNYTKGRRHRASSTIITCKTTRQFRKHDVIGKNSNRKRIPLTERKSSNTLKRARSLYGKNLSRPWNVPPRPSSTMSDRGSRRSSRLMDRKMVTSQWPTPGSTATTKARSALNRWKSALTERGSRKGVGVMALATRKTNSSQDAPLLLRNGQKFFGPSVLKGSVFRCSYCPLKTMTGLEPEQATMTIDVLERVLRKVTVIRPAETTTLETAEEFSMSSGDEATDGRSSQTMTILMENMKLDLSGEEQGKSGVSSDDPSSSGDASDEIQSTYGLTGADKSDDQMGTKDETEGCGGDQPDSVLTPNINCKLDLTELKVNDDCKIDRTDGVKNDSTVESNIDSTEDIRECNSGTNNSKTFFSFDASITDQRSFSFSTGLRGVLKDSARCRDEDVRSMKSVAFRSPIQSAREASYDESMSTLIEGSSGDLRDFKYLNYNPVITYDCSDQEYDPLESRTITPSLESEALTCRWKTPSPQKAMKEVVRPWVQSRDLSVTTDEFSEDNGISFLLTQKKLLPHRFPALSKALKQPLNSGRFSAERTSSSFSSHNFSSGYFTLPSDRTPSQLSGLLGSESKRKSDNKSAEESFPRLPSLESAFTYMADFGVCGRRLVRCDDSASRRG